MQLLLLYNILYFNIIIIIICIIILLFTRKIFIYPFCFGFVVSCENRYVVIELINNKELCCQCIRMLYVYFIFKNHTDSSLLNEGLFES